MSQSIQFYKLAVGALFEFEGKKYRKTAMNVASPEDGQENRIMSQSRGWEVLPIGEPPLLPLEVAETWKPWDLEHWADHMDPSPITRGDWGKTEPRW